MPIKIAAMILGVAQLSSCSAPAASTSPTTAQSTPSATDTNASTVPPAAKPTNTTNTGSNKVSTVDGGTGAGANSGSSTGSAAGGSSSTGGTTGSGAGGSTTSSASGGTSTTPVVSAGTVALSGLVGLARADLAVTGAPPRSNILVGIDVTGSITPITAGTIAIASDGFSLLDGTTASTGATSGSSTGATANDDDQIKCIVALASDSTLIQGVSQSTSQPLFANHATEVAIIGSDGSVKPVLPAAGSNPASLTLDHSDCVQVIQKTTDGSVFGLAPYGTALWQMSTTSHAAAVIARPTNGRHFTAYLAVDGPNVFLTETDGTNAATTWRRSDGTTIDLGYPSNIIASPHPFGATGMSFLANSIAGGEILMPGPTTALRQFVEPLYTQSGTYWTAPTNVTVGNWIVSKQLALLPNGGQMASNPFWRSYGRFQGLVDFTNQIYFDGSNLVKIQYDATSGLQVKFQQKILQDATLQMKVVAVFGPAQGFVNEWVGFASDQGFTGDNTISHLYWVYIDPATGVLDPTRIYQLSAENMPCYWYTTADGTANPCPANRQTPNGQAHVPEFTPYNIPTAGGTPRLVALGGTLGASVVNLSFVESPTRKLVVGASRGPAYTYDHNRAVIAAHRLYFTASYYDGSSGADAMNKMYYYDADSDTAADYTAGILPGNGTTPHMFTDHAQCAGGSHFGLLMVPGQSGPSMLYCRDDSSVQLTTFNDFSFAQAAANVTLPVVAPRMDPNHANYELYPDFMAGVIDSFYQLIVYGVNATTVAVGLGEPEAIRLTNPLTGTSLGDISFHQLNTEGRLEFSWIYSQGQSDPLASMGDVMTVATWDDHRLFISSQQQSDSAYVSYLVDLNDRSFTHLPDLDGISVSAVTRLDASTMLASGFASSALATPLTITLGNAGNKVTQGNSTLVVKDVAARAQ